MKKTYLILIFFCYTCAGFSIIILESNVVKFNEPSSKIQCFEKHSNSKSSLDLIFSPYNVDSTIKKNTREKHHIFSLDYGYCYPLQYIRTMNVYYGEVNLHYRFSYRMMMFDINYGINPFTGLGYFPKFYLLTGLTSDIRRWFSINCLVGLGGATYFDGPNTFEGRRYSFQIGGMCLKTGVFINPFKRKKLLFSIDLSVLPYSENFGRQNSNGIASFVNLSINYKFNYGKKK